MPQRPLLSLFLIAAVLLSSAPTRVAAQPPAGVQATGSPTTASIAPGGGQLALDTGALTVYAVQDVSRPPLSLNLQTVDARTVPAAQDGLSLGFAAFQLSAVNDDTQQVISSFNVPLTFVVKPGASDLSLALGQLGRLYMGIWNGSSWVALPCSADIGTNTMVCSTTRPGLFAPLVVLPANPVLGRLDFEVAGGHFYTQGNGFGGGGRLGYAVVDDGDAPMWSEFQRQGGIDRLGYPVTGRFLYAGVVTQAFQNGALQWVPEFGQAVFLNILDELHTHGSDGWLDTIRRVPPPPPDGQPGDADMLAPFPTILATYQADPELYGRPVSVRDYGQIGSARFQRSVLQVWQQDQPFAAAGAVLPGHAGDLARAAGLWPVDAATPGAPPAG
jgi:hypothetical protein